MSNQNTLREEAKEQQRQALKGKPLKAKISYILYYYKKHIIIGIVIAFVLYSLISNILTSKKNALALALVNCNREVDYDSFIQEYYKASGVSSEYDMSVDIDYAMVGSSVDYQLEQKFFLATAANRIDVVIAPASFYDAFAKMGYMQDFSRLLTEEEIAELGDAVHIVRLDDEHGGGTEISGIEVTDFRAVVDGCWFADCEEPIYFGIPIESENTAQALDFLKYIQK